MAVAEVAVTRLIGIGGPHGLTFAREIVVIGLLRHDDQLLFLDGGSGQQTLIDEGIVVAGLALVVGVCLDGKLLG